MCVGAHLPPVGYGIGVGGEFKLLLSPQLFSLIDKYSALRYQLLAYLVDSKLGSRVHLQPFLQVQKVVAGAFVPVKHTSPFMVSLAGIDEKNMNNVPPVTDTAKGATNAKTVAPRPNGPCVGPRLR